MTLTASEAMTSKAIKEYMVNAISMGIRPIGMKRTHMVEESMTSRASEAATSEAIKEYMVNAISMGIRPIGMKLGEDVDLEASCKMNYY